MVRSSVSLLQPIAVRLGSLVLGLVCATSLSAQPRPSNAARVKGPPPPAPASPIRVGDTRTGTFGPTDELVASRYSKDYTLTLQRGDQVQIDMVSEQIDSYLELLPPGVSEPLLQDDDAGGRANARLSFRAPLGGAYTIRAQSSGPLSGPFTLTVKTRDETSSAEDVGQYIPVGGQVEGLFAARDQRPDAIEVPTARYNLTGTRGKLVRVDMESAELDSRLSVRKLAASGEATYLVVDDDGGEGSNARIVDILPESGRYLVTAGAWPGEQGKYTIRVTQFPPRSPEVIEEAQVDAGPLHGRLTPDDPATQLRTGEDGHVKSLYKLYRLRAKNGQSFAVELSSSTFDPVLEAGVESPIGIAVAQTGEHAGRGDPTARLFLKPEGDVDIVLVVRTNRATASGAFSLTVQRGTPTP